MERDAYAPASNSGKEGEKVRKSVFDVFCSLCGAGSMVCVKNADIEKGRRSFRKF